MTKTYSQIVQQIETLKQQADSIRKKEVAEVVGRIKEAIAFYQLTAADLGLSGAGAAAPVAGKHAAVKTGKPVDDGAKFRDDAGNVWSGRGPRPRWLKAALAAGKTLDDFKASGSASSASAPMMEHVAATPASVPVKRRGPNKKKAAKSAPAAKYRDESGNSWSGRGPKPKWLKDGLAAGKSIESFTV